MIKLVVGRIYNGWKFVGEFKYWSTCDVCHRERGVIYGFVHPDTPINDSYGGWNGFKYDDEPMRYGTECVKKFIDKLNPLC